MSAVEGGTASVTARLLAAGAGRRMGGPKALLRDPDGVPFLDRAVGTLLDGGCPRIRVVLGAQADAARALLEEVGWLEDPALEVVVAQDWDSGMGASLRAGLDSLRADSDATLALVHLVDLPDVTDEVVRRVLDAGTAPETLARATYHGQPGHPVLIGSAHFARVAEAATGDKGARDYLAGADVIRVECADLATGQDVDRP